MASRQHALSHAVPGTANYPVFSIVVLGLLVSMGALHTDPIASSLPGMAQELGCSTNSTAFLVSAFLLGMTAGHLLIGPISDIIGRGRAILCGLLILSAGALLCALSTTFQALVTGRVIQGLGAAAALCSARAIGGDAGSGLRSARVLSLMQTISSATPIFMPLLGSGIAHRFGWRAVFWMMLAIDILLILGTLLFLPERAPQKKENVWGQLRSDISSAIRRPTFLLYTLAFGFGISTFYCYVSASSFALQNELGVSAQTYSRLLSCMGVIMVGSAVLATRLPKWCGLVRSFVGAVLLQLLCASLMAALFLSGAATVASTMICYALIAGTSSITIPIGLSLAVGEAGPIKGTASALCGFMQCLCSFAITSLLSTVSESGSIGAAAGLAMAVTTLAALTCCLIATRIVNKQAR